MRYAMHARDAAGGALFDAGRGCNAFTQRLLRLESGERCERACDEVVYVLAGRARVEVDGAAHELAPGTAFFAARGTGWTVEADAPVEAVSVLVHDPQPAGASHGLVDLNAAESDDATAGRAFLLGATPDVGCTSVTQFLGLIPPGRAPDHFHTYDEVIYVLEGAGLLEIEGEQAPIEPGTCIHLPARLVHCLANTGEEEMRVLGVFRPAGSPAEAYYPDGTLAVVPERS